jgi:carboxyl-terminal processing protease
LGAAFATALCVRGWAHTETRTERTPAASHLAEALRLRAAETGASSELEAPDGKMIEDDGGESRALVMPTGEPPALGCDQARRIIAQARSSLATPAEPIDAARFASSTSDWLDPHGLWSVAPDSPVAPLIADKSRELMAELEAAPGSGPCRAAEEIAGTLQTWVDELDAVVEAERVKAKASPLDARRAWETASRTPFEDGSVTRRARDLAKALGRDAGVLEAGYGAPLAPYAKSAIERLTPRRSAAEWSRVLLASAVRAYVPQIDPHGAWAPLDEETSIYDLDLEVDPPERLWGEMTRTTAGVRIDKGARAPLAEGDIVLKVDDLVMSGLSVEQDNQAAVLDRGRHGRVVVLRQGEPAPLSIEVPVGPELLTPPPRDPGPDGAVTTREVSYGNATALVVHATDVPDDLGDRIASCIHEARAEHDIAGIVLDLRGNGGGSTDGALGTLGVFLPGAPLFPMRRRDGEIEIDRAPSLPAELAWSGPVAALVDGDTASAAEMIAGAVASYERGVVVGTRTYGKGCAQEYLDDDGGSGVLRLTTLVFSLPDGSPLQQVGVSPQIALGIPTGDDREATLPHAPASWRGPDVRAPQWIRGAAWPDHGGRIGVSDDPVLYRALRALGTPRAASR